jgi:hypothetical protein
MKNGLTLKTIDIFGSSIKVNYKGQNKLKTYFGGILTILLIIGSIILVYYMGKEIIVKNNPNLIFTKIQRNISDVYLKDLPIFFDFLDSKGVPIDDIDKYADFYALQTNFVAKDGIFYAEEISNFTHERCDPDKHFGKYKDILEKIYIKKNALCFNFPPEMNFFNDFASIPSSNLGFVMNYCDNSKRPENNKCADPIELDRMWQAFFVRFSFPDYFLDPLNFDNPITLYAFTKIQVVSKDYNFFNYVQIQKTQMSTNIGWFADIWVEKTITQFKLNVPDVGTSTVTYPFQKMFTSFESPLLSDNYKRSYIQIPAILANVGGLLNLLILLGKLLCFKINEISMYLNESADLINFEEVDLERNEPENTIKNGTETNAKTKITPNIIKFENPSKNIEKERKSYKDKELESLKEISSQSCLKKDLFKENNLELNKNKDKSTAPITESKIQLVNVGNHENLINIKNKSKLVENDEGKENSKGNSRKLSSNQILKVNVVGGERVLMNDGNILDHANKSITNKHQIFGEESKEMSLNAKIKHSKIDGKLIQKDLGFCGYFSQCMKCNSKNEKLIAYDSIIDFFQGKLDVRNLIKNSNSIEVIKYLLLGDIPNYQNLFRLKFSLHKILSVYEDKLNEQKNEAKQRVLDKLNLDEKLDVCEDNFQYLARIALEEMKDRFNEKNLFE